MNKNVDSAEREISRSSRTIGHTLRQSNDGKIQQRQIYRFPKYTSGQHTREKLHVALQNKKERKQKNHSSFGEVGLGQALKTGEHLRGSAVSAVV